MFEKYKLGIQQRVSVNGAVFNSNLKAKLDLTANEAAVEIEVDAKSGDKVVLHFNEKGICSESKENSFRPVFRVISQYSIPYWIDVRRFFFTDMAYVTQLSSAVRYPQISIRKVSSPFEIEIPFLLSQ